MPEDWIRETVMSTLDSGSDAAKAVQQYIDGNATLNTAVTSLDKATGEFKAIMVDVPNGN